MDHLKKLGHIHANSRGHLVTTLHYQPGELASKPAGQIAQDVHNPESGFFIEYGNGGQISIGGTEKADTVVVDDVHEALALDVHQSHMGIRKNIIVVGRKPKARIASLLAAIAKSAKLFVSAARTEIGKRFVQWMRNTIPTIPES